MITEVELDGQQYRVNLAGYSSRYLDVIRQQADSQGEPSEASLNPNDLWRRSQTDWVYGMGQKVYDDRESERKRFNGSQRSDPWTRGEMTGVKGAARIDAYSGTIGKLVVADGRLWLNRGSVLSVYNGTTWSDCTFNPGMTGPIQDIGTDGTNVYVACSSLGRVTTGSTTIFEISDLTTPDLVDWPRGRLMVAAGADLYNITNANDVTSGGREQVTAFSTINENWIWDAFGDSGQYILAAGHSDDHSLVYRISIREDGTKLGAPIAASRLPDGEVCTAITSYLGVILLGTSRGLRAGTMRGGELVYGSVIDTDAPITSIEPQGRFVWFGWGDGELGRADLSRFIPGLELTPAYARDIKVDGAASPIRSVVTFAGTLTFCIEDVGVYEEDDFNSEVSQFTSGQITYGLPDNKRFVSVVVDHAVAAGESVVVEYQVDGAGAWVNAGTITGPDTDRTSFDLNVTGRALELRFTLNAAASSSPVLHSFSLRSLPLVNRTSQFIVPLEVGSNVEMLNGSSKHYDFFTELSNLRTLANDGTLVTYKEFDQTYTVALENVVYDGQSINVDDRKASWEGVISVVLRAY